MKLRLSKFGEKLCSHSGILELMDDLGKAMAAASPDLIMLGGGNPAAIPQMQQLWRERMQQILSQEKTRFDSILGNYDTPQGRPEFIEALVSMFRNKFGWPITAANIAISNGSQSGFFSLFNILAGDFSDATQRKILIPLMPEYIGYADQGISKDIFTSIKPSIEEHGAHEFKYRVDFSHLKISSDIAAIAVSRPSNPTGNVLTIDEVQKLSSIARSHGIPLIVDNAYGFPFPNIIFTESNLPLWEEHLIYSFSLSKIGLPGTRTGIIIAAPEIAQAITSANAIVNLANGNLGQALASELLRSGQLLQAASDVVKPFYLERAKLARSAAEKYFDAGLPWRLHACEGSLFFWLWLKDLPISSQQFYTQLKKKNVLVVSGHYFFFGLDQEWPHRNQCVRINYSQAPQSVAKGLEIIGQEMRQVYG